MSLLARSEATQSQFCLYDQRLRSCSAVKNIAVMARGSMEIPNTSEKNLNVDCQKSFSFLGGKAKTYGKQWQVLVHSDDS